MDITNILTAVGGFGTGIGAALTVRRRPKEPECTCGHGLASHSTETYKCGASVPVTKYDDGGAIRGKNWLSCSCMGYVGPKPPENYLTPGR